MLMPAATDNVVSIHPAEDGTLSLMIDAIRRDLATVVSLSSAERLSRKAKAFYELAKKADAALEIKVQAAELVLRCERATALAMVEAPKSKGAQGTMAGRDSSGAHTVCAPENKFKSLSQMGINTQRAHKLRQLARVDEDKFESLIEQGRVETIAKRDDRCNGLSVRTILSEVRYEERENLDSEFSSVIKPMDNWNFASVFYEKIKIERNEHGAESHGYIPGEVYANAIWYYAKPGDVVVEPMAGSGIIWKVWEDRRRWLRGWPLLNGQEWDDEDNDAPLKIRTFDLHPRGPYVDFIQQHDISTGFPIDHADYIFMDVPYFAIVNGQYSTKDEDLANMDEGRWAIAIGSIARSCSSAQNAGKLCSIMAPNWRDLNTGKIVLAPRIIQQAFEANGYSLHDVVYSSRRIQQQQTPTMAMTNNKAKRSRTMLTDIAEILTFRRD